MKKREKLQIKIKRFLKFIDCPRYLHHFGPKKYELSEHIYALLVKEVCRMSLRRLANFLGMIGIRCPTYSALCKSRRRIPRWIWDKFLRLTAGLSTGIVAIDGTGFSRTNPSFHYIKRIDRKEPVKSYSKLSAMFDIIRRKFLALKIRMRPRHDVKDTEPLIKKIKPKKLFADTGYDSEKIHEFCYWNKIQTFIKPRKNVRIRRFRKLQMENYSEKEYHQRSLIESGFGSLKRKYGGNVLGRKTWSVRSEINCKAISHNLDLMLA